MSFDSALQALMKLARVALAFIMLVGVPMADAAACASEEFTSTVELSVASDHATVGVADIAASSGDHDAGLPADAQHCLHGHCHHSTPFSDGEAAVQGLATTATAVAPLGPDMMLARLSAGLERPPKA